MQIESGYKKCINELINDCNIIHIDNSDVLYITWMNQHQVKIFSWVSIESLQEKRKEFTDFASKLNSKSAIVVVYNKHQLLYDLNEISEIFQTEIPGLDIIYGTSSYEKDENIYIII